MNTLFSGDRNYLARDAQRVCYGVGMAVAVNVDDTNRDHTCRDITRFKEETLTSSSVQTALVPTLTVFSFRCYIGVWQYVRIG
jgi:hypothetical protein